MSKIYLAADNNSDEDHTAVERRWTLDAVSYTHLDVYKRQAVERRWTLDASRNMLP